MRLAYTISSPPCTSVQIVFFNKDMTEIYFANYYESKSHRQRYKIKRLLYKSVGKCRIEAQNRALGMSLYFSSLQERWEWIILTIWIAHFILFLFCNKPVANFYVVRTVTAELPPPLHTSQYTFSWNTHPPSECTYFIDHPLADDFDQDEKNQSCTE